jgi:hypothetical protein
MMMTAPTISFAFVFTLTSPALSGVPADSDSTRVTMCSQMQAAAVIDAMSEGDAKTICRGMGLLDGVRVQDIRTFSKAALVLAHEGYSDDNATMAKQLVEIVRLRGLYDKPDRWYSTLDIIVRMYQASNGVVAPIDAIGFLRGAGKAGKALSDDGFKNMLILVWERKQHGDD